MTDTEKIIAKIEDLIRSLEGETPEQRKKRYEDYETDEQTRIINEQNKKKEELLKKYNSTEIDLIREKRDKELELFSDNEEVKLKIIEKYTNEEKELLEKREKERIKIQEDELEKELAKKKANGASTMQLLNERFKKEQEIYKDNEEKLKEIQKTYNKEINKARLDSINGVIDSIKGVVNAAGKRVKDIQESWGKADDAAYKYGRSVGLSSDKIEKLRSNTLDFLAGWKGISEQYNINAEELINLQGSYNKGLGRAVALNETNLENMISLRNVMGETAGVKFSTSLANFGIDIDAAGERLSELYNDAGSRGIVFSELSENLLNNIELAQQYTFDGGVEGLKRMAEQATALNWNMKQTASFAEKVGNIEGAVKTGAQLSVLGGPFAQLSNPMGMLYESLNDMEGLQDRMFSMFKNLGSWNEETNQFEVSAFNRQRIKAASQAMGLNYGDVMNNVYSSARREKVKDSIEHLGLDPNTMELIMNSGQIDKNGQVYVNYTDEKGNIIREDVSKGGLSNEALKILQKDANSQAQDVKDIAKSTMSTNEKIEGIHKQITTNKSLFYDKLSPTEWLPGVAKGVAIAEEALNQISMMMTTILAIMSVSSAFSGLKGFTGGLAGKTGIGGGAKGFFKSGGFKVGAIGVAGAAGVVGGSLMKQQADRLRERGNHEDADSVNKWGTALSWAGTGAMIGNAIVPGLGGVVGGLIGGIGGFFVGRNENKKLEEERNKQEKFDELTNYIYSKTGVWLGDNYSVGELESIKKGTSSVSPATRKKLEEDGFFYNLPSQPFEKGGLINGPSHSRGGVAVNGTNIEVEGGEFVINKTSTQNNLPLIKAINENKITPLQPMGEVLTVNGYNNAHESNHQVSFDTLNSNVSGNIKLDLGGYTKEIDGKELISNPTFISKMRDILIKEINLTNDKSFKKNDYYRKL